MGGKTVGEIIRKARKSAGMTQDEVAEKLGISRSVIAKYETGVISPTIDRLTEFMNAIGVKFNISIQNLGVVQGLGMATSPTEKKEGDEG